MTTGMTGTTAGAEPTRGGPRAWQLLTLMLAVIVAVLAFLVLRPAGEAGAEVEEPEVEEPEVAAEPSALTDTPEASAALACEIMAEVDPAGFEDFTTDEAWADIMRGRGAEALGYVAEAIDPSYEELRVLLGAPAVAYSTTYLMAEEYTEAVAAAQAACKDVVRE